MELLGLVGHDDEELLPLLRAVVILQ